MVKELGRNNIDPVVNLKRAEACAGIQFGFDTSLAPSENFAMLSSVSGMKTSRSQLEEDNMQSAVSQKSPSGSKLRILQLRIRCRGES